MIADETLHQRPNNAEINNCRSLCKLEKSYSWFLVVFFSPFIVVLLTKWSFEEKKKKIDTNFLHLKLRWILIISDIFRWTLKFDQQTKVHSITQHERFTNLAHSIRYKLQCMSNWSEYFGKLYSFCVFLILTIWIKEGPH